MDDKTKKKKNEKNSEPEVKDTDVRENSEMKEDEVLPAEQSSQSSSSKPAEENDSDVEMVVVPMKKTRE